MRLISINGHHLSESQINCLREILVVEITSHSETIRTKRTDDMTVFYHYRQMAFNLLQLIDEDPIAPLQQFADPDGHAGPDVCGEPVVIIDNVKVNYLTRMETRMAISAAGFNLEELKKVQKEKGFDIKNHNDLLKMIFEPK